MKAVAVPKNLRILLIDDNRAIHAGFRKILCSSEPPRDGLEEAENALFSPPAASAQRPSFELDSAYQGQEGLELAGAAVQAGRPYALAFVDVRMPPGSDGIETTAGLWRICPDLQVVICTAYSDFSWEDMSAKLGSPDRLILLKKPFEPVEVLQLASTLCEKWRLHHEAKLTVEHLERLVRERTRALEQANGNLQNEIAQRRRAQAERELTIKSLEEALANVKTLSGLIPICAGCKKIRDDRGFWNQVESYVSAHSEARFSHGLCPECAHKFYPEESEEL